MTMNQKILVANNFIAVPTAKETMLGEQDITMVTTIVSNLAYYGYIPSMEVVEKLKKLSVDELSTLWREVEPAIKELTGASKNMDQFVVYKNFPKEVLNKSQAEYWMAQILMYWGLPNELFTEEVEKREPMLEKMKLKVLALAPTDVFSTILNNLKNNSSRWSTMQNEHAQYLLEALKVKSLTVDDFAFKENGVVLANQMIKKVMEKNHKPTTALAAAFQKKGMVKSNVNLFEELDLTFGNATDVLRLAALMSEGDVSLREKVRFKKFKRSERKFLLSLLESTKNLVADCTLRPEVWKKLLAALHPGDYKFETVKKAYDILYRGDFTTFHGEVDAYLKAQDTTALKLLASRPGEFLRKLHHMYNLFGMEAVQSFVKVLPKLNISQLLKLDGYVSTINDRKSLVYPPKGNWTKVQVMENDKKFSMEAISLLKEEISKQIGLELDEKFPQGVDLDPRVKNIKLQTNDQKLASYGRGTVFSIPENMKFIRTASYWAHPSGRNTWFDNGWNFFDADWNNKFTCCWNSTNTHTQGAVFSGDPTNSKDMKGRACQMIDLDLDKLKASGVRYAVWNILCFSNVCFDEAEEVMGTLQWGEESQKGNLFEPSRAQMVFPITGQNMTKYVAYIDVVERKLVYMDANFAGNVSSASYNGKTLEKKMPAFVEYLASLPTVADLFAHAKKGTMPVWLDDESKKIEDDVKAYVFKPMNPENKFKKLELQEVVS